jgi:hypothetical protein
MTIHPFSEQMPGLAAEGPDPELGAAADLFAPLIGDWQMRTSLMPLDGPQVDLEGSQSCSKQNSQELPNARSYGTLVR